MSQNSARRSWSEGELQQMLQDIMSGIHARCLTHGEQPGGYVDYVKGANIAGFKKVADAMLAFGLVSAPIGPTAKGVADMTPHAGQEHGDGSWAALAAFAAVLVMMARVLIQLGGEHCRDRACR